MEPNEHMSNKNPQIYLGEMLKQSRIKKEMTVEELSAITKISKSLILSLEQGRFENLPNKIYVQGFLKSLSNVLHFNLKDALIIYENSLATEAIESIEAVIPLQLNNRYSKKFYKKIYICTAVSSLLLILILFPLLLTQPEIALERKPASASISTKVSNVVKQPEITKIKKIKSGEVVTINANFGASWLAFKVDHNPVRRFTLKKGGSIVLKGQSIRLVAGNFKNLTIKNNNELVAIKDSSKNVISLVFPEELEKKYTTPYFVFTEDGTAKTLKQYQLSSGRSLNE